MTGAFCEITKIYPTEFTITKSGAMTLSRSPRCRAVMTDEKSSSPLFPIGAGGGGWQRAVTNDWVHKLINFCKIWFSNANFSFFYKGTFAVPYTIARG